MLGVYRRIVRHARHVPGATTDAHAIKERMRNSPLTVRSLRGLFDAEEALRRVAGGVSTLSAERDILFKPRRATVSLGTEINQGGKLVRWLQQPERRFDKYNAPPPRSSAQFRAVDRRARLANASANFIRAELQNSAETRDQPLRHRRSAVIDTVFAPFWKAQRARRVVHDEARPVELRSVRRAGGSLALLRVRGVPSRARGFRARLNAVNRDEHVRLADLEYQRWLANEYAKDPLEDLGDLSDWQGHLGSAIAAQRRRIADAADKLEVHRRILLRRRAEMQRDWDWRGRRRAQNEKKQAKRVPPPLLRLETL